MIALPTWLAVVGPLLAVATLLLGLGRVLQRLDTIATEHTAARAESKAQHEETRREIGGLREARVASEATAEHQRADLDALREAMREVREDVRRLSTDITDTRHTLRAEMQTAIAAQRSEVPHVARPARRG